MPRVSVIITTKNEEKNIERCLKAVQEQTFKDLEILVVDNSSTDRTKELSLQYTDRVFDKGPERSAQRNFGVEESRGEFVLYLDADMALDPRCIADCVAMMDGRQSLVGLYIPERIVGEGFWIKVRDFERSFYHGTVIDAVRFIRRAEFLQIKGFDLSLCGPEDWDFDKRLKEIGETAVGQYPLFHDEGAFDLDFYLGKKSYYAATFDMYVKKWGAQDRDVRRQLGVVYRFVGVFIEKGKFLRLLIHPLLTAGMYYLRFRVGLQYLQVLRAPAEEPSS